MTKKQYKKAKKIYQRDSAKRGNKPNPVVLTTKAIKEILLTLRCAHRATDAEREYLKWVAKKLEAAL